MRKVKLGIIICCILLAFGVLNVWAETKIQERSGMGLQFDYEGAFKLGKL